MLIKNSSCTSVMEKRTLNLRVTCKMEYTFFPAEECVSNFDLPTFLCDLHNNLEKVNLLEEGEIVVTDSYELAPFKDKLISISKLTSNPGQSPFYVSCSTLKSISETLAHYDLEERFLEIGLGFTNSSNTIETFHSQLSTEPFVPESDIGDDNQISADDASLLNHNNNAFRTKIVEYPEAREIDHPSSRDVDSVEKSSQLSYFKLASEISAVTDDDTPDPPDFMVQESADDLSSPDVAIDNSDDGFLNSPRLSDDDLPPIELNILETLKVYLGKEGPDAESSLNFYPQRHETAHNPVFSNRVSFRIGPVLYSYDSCTRFVRKSDALKNVAYQACKTLGLSWKPNQPTCIDHREFPPESMNVIGLLNQYLQKVGAHNSLAWHFDTSVVTKSGPLITASVSFSIKGSSHRFETANEFSNKGDAKKSAAYKACKSLGLC